MFYFGVFHIPRDFLLQSQFCSKPASTNGAPRGLMRALLPSTVSRETATSRDAPQSRPTFRYAHTKRTRMKDFFELSPCLFTLKRNSERTAPLPQSILLDDSSGNCFKVKLTFWTEKTPREKRLQNWTDSLQLSPFHFLTRRRCWTLRSFFRLDSLFLMVASCLLIHTHSER